MLLGVHGGEHGESSGVVVVVVVVVVVYSQISMRSREVGEGERYTNANLCMGYIISILITRNLGITAMRQTR